MRDIVLALFIFGTIPFILSRPYIGLLVWSWIGYMNPHRLTYGFAYSFPWVMLIAAVTLIALAVGKEPKRIPKSCISVLLFVYLAWTCFTTFFAVEQSTAWDQWNELAKTLVMVFVTFMLINTRQRIHALVWVIVVSIGFYGIKGGLFTLLTGGGSHVVGPPSSFIGDNNALALALCMTLPLMRYLQAHATYRSVRWALGVGMVLMGIAILGTYSRGGLIGLLVVSAALLIKGRHKAVILIAFVIIGATAYHFMPPQWMARMHTLQDARQTDSGETRIQSWEFAANVAFHRPLVAGGFNDYQNTQLWNTYAPEGAIQRAVHSIYFRTLGEQGFIGLALFLTLLAISWRNCSVARKRARGDPHLRWVADLSAMLQVSLVAFLTSGAFLPMAYFDLTYQLMALSAILVQCALAAPASEMPASHANDPAWRDPRRETAQALARGPSHG